MVQKHSQLPIPAFLIAYLTVDLLIAVIGAPDMYQSSARSWELSGKIDKTFTPLDCTQHGIHINVQFCIHFQFFK